MRDLRYMQWRVIPNLSSPIWLGNSYSNSSASSTPTQICTAWLHNQERVGCQIPWPFFSRKPETSALTSINRRKSVINPEIASINVCQRPVFCDFPSFSMEILTAPLQIGTPHVGFSAQFPAKNSPGNLTPDKRVWFWKCDLHRMHAFCKLNARVIVYFLQCFTGFPSRGCKS